MRVVIALVVFVSLVILAAQKMVTGARHRKLAEAKVPSKITGHSELKTGETLIDQRGGIRLAFDKLTGKLMRFVRQDGHGLVVGYTGVGKSASWIIAAILDLAGQASMIYIDPKGNTTAICGRYLAEMGRLIVCSPYENQKDLFPKNMKLPVSTPYNPMKGLSPDNYGFTSECERIADIFPDNVSGGNENAMHFKYRATDLIAGIIMHVCDRTHPDYRHLSTVRNVITSSNGEDLWVFLLDVRANGTPYCQQKLASYAETDEEGKLIARTSREAQDVIATASRYTRWFGNEDIGPSLEEDGFSYASLKEEATAVALICPFQYMHTSGGKWLKLHVTSAIHELWRNGRGKLPVYLFLDESDQYADPIIHAAINTARNFGIVLIIMVQQISDIENRYGKQAGAFINGTAWKIIFASDDERTREVVEKLSGTKAVMVPSVSLDGSNGAPKLSFGERGLPLMAGYEVGEIPPDECLLHIKGLGLVEAKRKPYWQDDTLKSDMWEQDPYEK